MIPWLRAGAPFPQIESALADPPGLLAAGGDLSPERLLDAYRHGIFPWYSDGQPILWWSPDPRMVLYVDEFKAPRSLRKVAKQGRFEITIDADFPAVIEACAAPRDGRQGAHGTWITQAMMDAYVELHRQGHAHSVEAWRDGRLAGGLYGIAIGRMFFGESMFAREPDASKLALVELMALLTRIDVPLVDCQQETAHLARFGARPIPRQRFAEELLRLVHSASVPGDWKSAAALESDRP